MGKKSIFWNWDNSVKLDRLEKPDIPTRSADSALFIVTCASSVKFENVHISFDKLLVSPTISSKPRWWLFLPVRPPGSSQTWKIWCKGFLLKKWVGWSSNKHGRCDHRFRTKRTNEDTAQHGEIASLVYHAKATKIRPSAIMSAVAFCKNKLDLINRFVRC